MSTEQQAQKCANGKFGYDIDSGKQYQPKPACGNDARPGHIYCDQCRVEAGGVKR